MKKSLIENCSGFTLIELIAVIAILGILASMAIPRFVDLSATAGKQFLVSSLAELNGRESLTWCKIKVTTTGWVNDTGVFSEMNTDLGTDYKWSPKAKIDGGILHYKGQMIKLKRAPSTTGNAGKWEIIHSSD